MRSAVTTMLLALCWTAASGSESARTVPIEAGLTISLKAGETAPMGDGILRVGFEGVTADSRCPKGQQCVWAGDATVRIWLQRGAEPKEVRELHTASGNTVAVTALDHSVRLVGLAPTPITGKSGTKPEYVATLTLVRGSALNPDR